MTTRHRQGAVVRATVPETSINKHRQPFTAEEKVRPPRQFLVPSPALNTEFPENFDEPYFRGSISRPRNSPHDAASGFLAVYVRHSNAHSIANAIRAHSASVRPTRDICWLIEFAILWAWLGFSCAIHSYLTPAHSNTYVEPPSNVAVTTPRLASGLNRDIHMKAEGFPG